VHRRVLPIAASASTASLALLGAAWAATGALPLVGDADPARAPLAITAQATGPLIANDRDGQAILTAPAMRPGVPAVGEVTVSNAGNAAGLFTLSSAGAADGSGALSGVLDLAVSDVTQGAGTTLYTGKLATFGRLPLGTLAAGAARRYRFALTFPPGRPDVADNALQGATTSVAFNWNTVAVAGPPAPNGPAPAPAPTPAPPAPAPARPAVRAPSGAKTGTAAPAAGARVPVPATPAAGSVAGMRLNLGAARRPVAKKRLVLWMTSTATTPARVTGTVTVGRKRYKLKAASVTLTAKRRTVRLRLPRQASGRRKRLTVRLTVSAGSGRARVALRRTLRVRTP
jgi:hypothetical protein